MESAQNKLYAIKRKNLPEIGSIWNVVEQILKTDFFTLHRGTLRSYVFPLPLFYNDRVHPPARTESSSGRVRLCSGRDNLIIKQELVYILCTSCVHLLYMCCTHEYTICTEDVHKMYTSSCSIIAG